MLLNDRKSAKPPSVVAISFCLFALTVTLLLTWFVVSSSSTRPQPLAPRTTLSSEVERLAPHDERLRTWASSWMREGDVHRDRSDLEVDEVERLAQTSALAADGIARLASILSSAGDYPFAAGLMRAAITKSQTEAKAAKDSDDRRRLISAMVSNDECLWAVRDGSALQQKAMIAIGLANDPPTRKLAVAAKPAYVEGLYLQHRNVEALQAADRYLAPGNDLRSEQRSLVSYYRGMILLDLGRVKDAIAVLKAATEQTRTRKIAIINLFEAQLRDDDCVAAEATLNDITRNYHNTLGRLARLKAELAHAKETHGILPLNEAPRVSNRLSDGSERREPVIGVTEDRHATR